MSTGIKLKPTRKALFAIMMDLASGKVKKEELAEYLKKHSKKRAV
jgi:hypothetical protein